MGCKVSYHSNNAFSASELCLQLARCLKTCQHGCTAWNAGSPNGPDSTLPKFNRSCRTSRDEYHGICLIQSGLLLPVERLRDVLVRRAAREAVSWFQSWTINSSRPCVLLYYRYVKLFRHGSYTTIAFEACNAL